MMLRTTTSLSIIVALALASAFPASGTQLSGNVATTYYSWEENRNEEIAHNYLIHYLRLNLTGIAGNKISFHAYGSGRYDLVSDEETELKGRLYNGYLSLKPLGRKYDLRLGRHFVYAGSGSGTVDGVSLKAALPWTIRLKGFFGTLGHESRDDLKFQSVDEGNRWGVAATGKPFRWLSVSADYHETRRNEEVDSERVGARMFFTPCSYFSFTGAGEMEVPFARLIDLSLIGDVRYGDWSVSTRYRWREPDLPQTSFFSVFKGSDSQTAGITVGRSITKKLGADLVARSTRVEDDRVDQISMAIRYEGSQFGYMHSNGFGGRKNGAFLTAMYTPLEDLTIVGRATYNAFELEGDDDENSSLVGSLEARYSFAGIMLRARAELLSNEFYDSDVRMLLKLSRAFSVRM
jgi:hypothetical protein